MASPYTGGAAPGTFGLDTDDGTFVTDIRMDGVGFSTATLGRRFCLRGVTGPVSLCYVVRAGPLWLEVESGGRRLDRLEPGTVVGLSGVVDHWFKSAPDLPVMGAQPLVYAPLSRAGPTSAEPELLIGHAPMEALAFTNTITGAVIIPPDGGRIARRILRAIDGIEDELRDQEPIAGTSAIVRRLSETILMNITRWVTLAEGETVTTPLGALADIRVMRALSAAAKAPLRAWTVADLADVAGMSRTAFAERFHQLTGDTPLHMITRLRLRLAAEALTEGSVSLEAAAALAGYGSAAAFTRAFRRCYGAAPARWRADHGRARAAAHAATRS